MKFVVTEFASLDGVMEEPQNWSFPYWNDEIGILAGGARGKTLIFDFNTCT